MYKLIDGILYQTATITAEEVKAKLTALESSAKSYTEGIKTCDKEIERLTAQKLSYQQAITSLAKQNGVDKEMAEAVSPEIAKSVWGF